MYLHWASPKTYWLNGIVSQVKDRGFILTGRDVGDGKDRQDFETSMPGVFACGDVRQGSCKRIATAVGEGAVVAQQVLAHLAKLEA